MAYRYIAFLGVILFLAAFRSAAALALTDLLPQEQAFPLAVAVDAAVARLHWNIAPGYYLYRNKFKFVSNTPGVRIDAPALPAGTKKHDKFFSEMEIYRGPLEIVLPLKRDDPAVSSAEITVGYQGCADAAVCFPPLKRTVTFDLQPGEPGPPVT